VDGDWKRKLGQDLGEFLGGLLWGADRALLGLNGGQGCGQLGVALFFLFAGVLDGCVLGG
jgi:hypothetical protein